MTTTSVLLYLLIILALIILSALCAGAEVAVFATSRVRLYHQAKKGNHKASIILELQERIGNFMSAILLLNTWSNTMMTAFVSGVFSYFFGAIGSVYAAFIMSAFITVYGEIAPKLYVYINPDRVALMLAPFLKGLVFIFSPVTRTLDFMARGSLSLIGVKVSAEIKAVSTAEELRGAIELHSSSGESAAYERSMLRSVLDLTTVQVTEIMIHRKNMFLLDASLPVKEIIEKVLHSPYTRVPLWRETPDNIIGVLHVRDLLKALQNYNQSLENLSLEKMITTAWFVPETTTLFSQLQAFRERRGHFALVVDEYGALQGMVTLEDILEEIVGEIVDEHDIDLTGVRLMPDSSYIIEGIVTIRDLNRQFGWELSDEHAATLAGLILHETRQIPEVGQSFFVQGFRMDILRRRRHQITQIRVTPSANTTGNTIG